MSRITIGVLLDHMNYFGGAYEAQLRRSLDRSAREHDLNLLMFYGHALDEPSSWGWTHNVIFDLVSRRRVSGLIVASSTIATYSGVEGVSRLLKQYRGLPACSIGLAVPEIPSVVIDNQPGMAAVLEHAICVHHAQRIAFLTGPTDNPEARLRLEACIDVFRRLGMPWDDSLVECGKFMTSEGRVAMRRVLDRHPDVDAVVAANDSMAFGAMEVLRERGRRIPEDVLVTGFDDIPWAALGNPALTTVTQPLGAIAEWAIGAILDQIHGKEVPRLESIPTQIMLRNSCGCRARLVRLSNGSASSSTPRELLHSKWNELERRLSEEIDWTSSESDSGAAALLRGLDGELNGVVGAFERALDATFNQSRGEIHRIRKVQNAITILYELLRDERDARLENMWFRAMSFTLSASLSLMVQQSLARGGEYLRLTTASDQISGAFDLTSLQRVLAETLPGIGVGSLYLCHHPSGQVDALVPLVHLRDGQSRPIVEQEFDAQDLYPNDEYLPDRRHTSLVFPLALEGQHLGVAVIEYEVGVDCYHIVRDQVTSALRAVALHQAVVKQTMLHERTIQERVSTSKRLQALSVLAGGVAHDLNNVLGPLVALPDVILAELRDPNLTGAQLNELCSDIQSIKRASVRASQTIKDLLTLGRQGKTRLKPLDLREALTNCLGDEFRQAVRTVNPHVDVVLELPPEVIAIKASDTQLARAITNLVRNGVEAIAGAGCVTLRLRRVTLSCAVSGFETVEPGEYAMLSCSDTGSGIPAEDIGQVFEPFYSQKRVREHSGTGLGLAIVHGVVKEHEGFIDVISQRGLGTTFTLYFPISSEPVRYSYRESLVPRGSARILVVDDEPVQLRTARRVLTQLGYSVEVLSSGTQAIELFRRSEPGSTSPYELVVLDMILNEQQDGLQVLERIRETFPAQRAILASGHAPTNRIELATEQGLVWLAKPYTADALGRAVRTALTARMSGSN